MTVQPRASRTQLAGLDNGALRLRVAAPPVDGAANALVIDFLSKRLDIGKSNIELVSGAASRRKRVLIHGMDAETVRAALGV